MYYEGGVVAAAAAAAAAVTFGEFRLLIEGVEKRRRKRYVWKDREENCKALYRSGARSMPASLLALSLSLSLFPHSLIFSTLFPHTLLYLLIRFFCDTFINFCISFLVAPCS